MPHLITGFDLPCPIYNFFLFLFGQSCKFVQDIRVLGKFHGKTDREFTVIYHPYHLNGRLRRML